MAACNLEQCTFVYSLVPYSVTPAIWSPASCCQTPTCPNSTCKTQCKTVNVLVQKGRTNRDFSWISKRKTTICFLFPKHDYNCLFFYHVSEAPLTSVDVLMPKPNQTWRKALSHHRTDLFHSSFVIILEGTDKLSHPVFMSIRSESSLVCCSKWHRTSNIHYSIELEKILSKKTHFITSDLRDSTFPQW